MTERSGGVERADGFARRWILRVSLVETAGFAVAAIAGASLAFTGAPAAITIGVDLTSPVTWVVMVAGAVLLLASIPVAQWLVLRAAGRRGHRAVCTAPLRVGVTVSIRFAAGLQACTKRDRWASSPSASAIIRPLPIGSGARRGFAA